MRLAALGAALAAFLLAAEERVLFDFRTPPNPKPAIPAKTRALVLSAVFPRFLTNEQECREEPPPTEQALEAARNAGRIAPEVLSGSAGSFTRPGAREFAYLIKTGECGAAARSYFGTYRLAIFQNDRLVANVPSPGGDSIAAVAEINNDGIQPILVSGCGFGQGVECSAHLLSMAGGSLKTIREFPVVYEDGCDSSRESGVSAMVIAYAPGRPPQFLEHEYRAPCPPPGRKPEFSPVGKGRP